MLVVFPLGLFTTAVIFDILFLITKTAILPTVSFYMIAAGVVGGLLAAFFGFMEWMTLPYNSRARHIAAWHGIGNFVIVVLFGLSWLLRSVPANHDPSLLALLPSFAGILLALVTAWLGGELVYRLGSGVDQGANANAPSSLSNKPATASQSRSEKAGD